MIECRQPRTPPPWNRRFAPLRRPADPGYGVARTTGARSSIVRIVRLSLACLISQPQVFPREFPVPFQGRVDVWLCMKHHPVLEVTALLAVLEQHERGNTQHGHDVLQDHVHRQSKHLSMKKPSENVRDDRQGEDRKQVFGFESEKCDSCPEIAVRRCNFKRHLFISYGIPPVPRATKNSASRSSPERSRQRPAATKCLIHPSVGWIRVTIPMRRAPAATCKPAYTGISTLQTQSTRLTKDIQ